MKLAFVALVLTICSVQAQVKPDSIDLSEGPEALVSYTNLYNSSDLRAVCVVYADGTGLLMGDAIVPVRKPKTFAIADREIASLRKLIEAASEKMSAPVDFDAFNAIPSFGDRFEPRLAALYYGKSDLFEKGEILSRLPVDSALGKRMRTLCGFGD